MKDKITKWKLTRINQGFKMTRANHTKQWIEVRNLNFIEKILFYLKTKTFIYSTNL